MTIRQLNSDPINFAARKAMDEKDLPYDLDAEIALLSLASNAVDVYAETDAELDLGQMLIADVSVKEQMLKNLRKFNRDWTEVADNLLERGLTVETLDLLVEAWPFKENLATYNPPEDWTR